MHPPVLSGGVARTNIVLAQWDGEEETIKGGGGSQEEKRADILPWGCHEAEVVHRRDSGDKEASETTCSGSSSLDNAMFPEAKVAATQVAGERLRKWLQYSKAEN
jgi:hypothetical protein